jgi:RNA polymerase sigma-70 factor (ECF subfamily)
MRALRRRFYPGSRFCDPERIRQRIAWMNSSSALRMVDPNKLVPLRRDSGDDQARAEETRWLERVRDASDTSSFNALFERYTPRLTRWMRAQGCESTAAETIVQEVMVTVWTNARMFDSAKASARTWLYALARNRMIDHHRANTRRYKAHEALRWNAGEEASEEHLAEGDVNRSRMAGLLEALPPEQREILLLAYVEGRSHREIARELELPVGTVKSRARLAFKKLRVMMGEPA